jgi:hypothetical protein
MQGLKKALHKEQFKHTLFPSLLLLVQEVSTWEARAACLNRAGMTTFHGKPWTKQNVHKQFNAYWGNDASRYSWHEHQTQLNDIAAIISAA